MRLGAKSRAVRGTSPPCVVVGAVLCETSGERQVLPRYVLGEESGDPAKNPNPSAGNPCDRGHVDPSDGNAPKARGVQHHAVSSPGRWLSIGGPEKSRIQTPPNIKVRQTP
ncbi:hypothetical protein GCM10018773_45520 [Streptomyces candidus]|nr:hypothetical protein GCM10018773_45520 [Streptomyces candidus]